ncbi:AdoMet-homocysteine methyltransferase [Puccinia graminis f. sp. tritici]|uniref:Hcy-binding domain-containing protein n=2 Tax=Puccinia graminis f. sp. tritici TaxID=56615 RepID=E3K086_PUCGT|nr:uncharacterized protein PGTG_03667 [Puccinia graminis f. sp. tritici CRL 75-36-700-3]EFP77711.2 hypothetical protein PGTG_03667 [Puccinia graminis f. sp. tritici CRL 75-36-700-3]KAA1110276.1 AdoMet-homocysteine methyltransferase [Puccinia graminis f. sp. tritici]
MERLFPNHAGHPKIVLMDGGSGTTLEDEFGCRLKSQLWSSELLLNRPEILSSLHHAWEQAGAQIISTASYQATLEGFRSLLSQSSRGETEEKDVGSDVSLQLLRRSVALARDSLSGSNARVALSLGPYGATLTPGQEYSGCYPAPYDSEEKLVNFHFDRLMDYAEDYSTWEKVDIVLFETVPNLTEARAIRRAWKKFERTLHALIRRSATGANPDSSSKPWVISFVFPTSTGQFPTGENPSQVLQAALITDADAELAEPSGVGVNCTKLGNLQPILEAWRTSAVDHSKTWLWLYPDGGPTYDSVNRSWTGSPITHQEWANQLFTIASNFSASWAGIVLGGCCKAGTPHIRALHQLLSSTARNEDSLNNSD